MDKLIYLAKEYDLVVGDRFELFYSGVIRSMNPYKYYIYITSLKGKPYPRYYTYTPKDGEEGEYELTLCLYDDYHNLIEEAKTKLVVRKAVRPKRKMNVLCIGDSLTFNGMWVGEGTRRFQEEGGEPVGLGLSDSINLIGTCNRYNALFEGYGGWQWKTFCSGDSADPTQGIWVVLKNHQFTEHDQHSVWVCDNYRWVMESIEKDKIKFKRAEGNYFCGQSISNVFKHESGGVHFDEIHGESFFFEKMNPFYSKELGDLSFKKYCETNGFEGIDYVYILLSWNGQYIQYNHHPEELHEVYIKKILDTIHNDYPMCKIRLLGIQAPSLNGGIAANYGAHGMYHDVFGELSTAFFYDEYLEKLCERSEYKDFMRYIDVKGVFDSEYNMPSMMVPVNNRSKIMERIGTNAVHPTTDGYLQIGDCFFRSLVRDMSDEA